MHVLRLFDYVFIGTDARVPVPQVEALSSVTTTQVRCGGSHTVVLDSAGDAYAFGRGDHGRLGFGRRVTSYVPITVHLHHEDEVCCTVAAFSCAVIHCVVLCCAVCRRRC